ncbi:MAG: TIM barrel protein [Bacteroidales bacterium]|nr:TIM barrel protein [Bacteroidales bacterium]
MKKLSRRAAIKTASAGVAAAAMGISAQGIFACQEQDAPLKGYVKHSVSYWCYGKYPLEELARICKQAGIASIELLGPKDWPVVQQHGLTCACANGAELGIDNGWNNPELHDKLTASYEAAIPAVAKAGLTNLICFSGKRNGLTDEQGWENCAKGLKRIMKTAEKHKVTLVMELLNSYGHKDYQCDHTAWGVELCKRVGSENFKLLYDIYHMQIMEGNIIDTLTKNIACIAHVHTGGNPGRNEIDETQELYYPAIIKALMATGYKGFVGQEFVPKAADPIASLKKCVGICDVGRE